MERLHLKDRVEITAIKTDVVVVTQLIYPGIPEKEAYETMVDSANLDRTIITLTKEYKDVEEARKGHKEIVEKLKRGKYYLAAVRWEIHLSPV